jgi:hypothetical protein
MTLGVASGRAPVRLDPGLMMLMGSGPVVAATRNSQELWMRFLGRRPFRTSTSAGHLLRFVVAGMVGASWSGLNRSRIEIGSPQHGHSAPGPGRRHHVLGVSHRCSPR